MPLPASPTAAPAASPVTTGRSTRAGRSAPAGLWVFADQGVVSLANFAAPILVGCYAGQEQLGYFALGFSVYLFVLGMGRALIWTAFTRRWPQLPPDERVRCAGSATAHLVLFLLTTVLCVGGLGVVMWLTGHGQQGALLGTVALASVAMLTREHARRLGLARMAFREVFLFDVSICLLQVGLLLAIAYSGHLSATTAFASLGATSLLAMGWMFLTRGHWRVERSAILPDWRASWSISKWLTGGAASVQLGNQGYRWLLPLVASITELGRLGAGQSIVQAANPLVLGSQNFLGPVSAKVYADQGLSGLWSFTVRASGAVLAAIAAFVCLVATVGLPVVQFVFRDSSEGVTRLLLVSISVGVLSEALLVPIEFASVNLGRTRLMFQTALARLAVNASIGFMLVSKYGAEAIGVGMLLGSLIALTWQWGAFAREVRRA